MKRKWWKEAVVYQIYPRSFADSNGDGIGDLQGIISKLDYIKSIGADVIWLSPIYKSPNDDCGYDISDYRDIMNEFGNMADFDDLLAGAHKRSIKLIMDLVINHTSDEHQWFIESRSSKDNEKRDYYIWRVGKDGKKPPDMATSFSPSIWELDENTKEYYLHLFSKKQVDLNWKNPKVKEEIFDMVKWWLDKGVDGFRMDAFTKISKNDRFLEGIVSSSEKESGILNITNQTGVHDILRQLNQEVLSKYDVMTVGEVFEKITVEEAADYIADQREELNMIFNFELAFLGMSMEEYRKKPWKVVDYKNTVGKWQLGLQGKGWNSLFLGNHDLPRHISQYGNDSTYRVESAKMFAAMLFTLQGTPYIYQGEEIGMTNVKFDSIEDYRDIVSHNLYKRNLQKLNEKEALKITHSGSRDNARTPMQWNDSINAGFTSGNPWIKVNPNYKEINVETAEKNPDSILNFYRKLIKLRKENLVMIYGEYIPILTEHEKIFSYIRRLEGDSILVILNFSEQNTLFSLPDSIKVKNEKLLISNYNVNNGKGLEKLDLKPFEARVYKI